MSEFEVRYLETQYGLLVAQIALTVVTIYFYSKLVTNDNRRDKRFNESEIKDWCKSVFRAAGSPGELQRAGQRLRKKYPNEMNLILIAYEEISIDEPSASRPVLYKFLELMEGIESGKWPSAAKAMSGKSTF